MGARLLAVAFDLFPSTFIAGPRHPPPFLDRHAQTAGGRVTRSARIHGLCLHLHMSSRRPGASRDGDVVPGRRESRLVFRAIGRCSGTHGVEGRVAGAGGRVVRRLRWRTVALGFLELAEPGCLISHPAWVNWRATRPPSGSWHCSTGLLKEICMSEETRST